MLILGDKTKKKVPFAWEAWLVLGKNRKILVDTGFKDDELARHWDVRDYRTVPSGLAELGIKPGQITDVVLSHAHWDHIGNVLPYTHARVWMQKREFEWASKLVSKERPSRWGVRLVDIRALGVVRSRGLLHLVGKGAAVAHGIIFHDGGGHTKCVQWLEIRTGGPVGTVVLASDNAYVYENIKRLIPTGSTSKPDLDRLALKEMLKVASRPDLVIPGHDPGTFKHFPRVAKGIVEIR